MLVSSSVVHRFSQEYMWWHEAADFVEIIYNMNWTLPITDEQMWHFCMSSFIVCLGVTVIRVDILMYIKNRWPLLCGCSCKLRGSCFQTTVTCVKLLEVNMMMFSVVNHSYCHPWERNTPYTLFFKFGLYRHSKKARILSASREMFVSANYVYQIASCKSQDCGVDNWVYNLWLALACCP